MGRSFEKRKHKMFARYDKMAKAFTRLGKEIAMAVKQGGENPDTNPRLRMAMQTAKGLNMPKDRIENAIKRAASKDESAFEEITYEAYAPHGIALIVETATDNPTRTVANVRMRITRAGGTLGKTGSLDFIFARKAVFKIEKASRNLDDLELQLIDAGLEDIHAEENEIYIYTSLNDFGTMTRTLEEASIAVISAEKQRIPLSTVELNESQQTEVIQLVEALEQDDDVQQVFYNMK